MLTPQWLIRLEAPEDAHAIDLMQDEAFGPGRFALTSSRIREGVDAANDLCFVGLIDGVIAGSVRLTPIMIGETPAMLLGPLTVSPNYKNRGLGKALLKTAKEMAEKKGIGTILLVGDAPYYAPAGYTQVPHGRISLPGPVDPNRLLAQCLNGAELPQGMVRGGHGEHA
ncbi:N-acetyltransferase [Rhodobacteraceae bacterium RKSG542]|nr:N-acetyltransferase [Pseudovibrio flavus]